MPNSIRPNQQVLAAALPLPLTSIDLLRQVVERLYGTGDTMLNFDGDILRVIAPADGFGPLVRDTEEFDLPAPNPGDARIRDARLADGKVTMTLEEATDAVGAYLIAQALYFEANEGINYLETSLTTPGGEPEYTVVLQKAGKPTPHELRTAAEQREQTIRTAAQAALHSLRHGDEMQAHRVLADALGE